jgi:hypothetical protein
MNDQDKCCHCGQPGATVPLFTPSPHLTPGQARLKKHPKCRGPHAAENDAWFRGDAERDREYTRSR